MKKIGKHKRRAAFSLLELTLVIVIMGLLVAVVATNVLGAGDRAKKKTTRIGLESVNQALKAYHLENSAWPTDLQTLVRNKMVEGDKLKDAWGTPYQYDPRAEGPDRPYTFFSSGPDKVAGNEDDISIWDAGAPGENR